MAQVGVGVVRVGRGCLVAQQGAVHHHQLRGIAFGELGRLDIGAVRVLVGVGHVQHEVAPAARAQRAHQQGAPVRGDGRIAGVVGDVHVTRHRRTIDEVAVAVVGLGQLLQVVIHTTRHVGEQLGAAILDRKAVQHAVVAAHVQHGRAISVDAGEGGVAGQRMVAHRAPGVPHLRVHDVALARGAPAEGLGGVVHAGALLALVAAQVVQLVLAAQRGFLRRAQPGLVGGPLEGHTPVHGRGVAPAEHHAAGDRGVAQVIEFLRRAGGVPGGTLGLGGAVGLDLVGLDGAAPAFFGVVFGHVLANVAARNAAAAGGGAAGAGLVGGVDDTDDGRESLF